MSAETKWLLVLGALAVVVALFVWALCASAKRADESWEEIRRREGMGR